MSTAAKAVWGIVGFLILTLYLAIIRGAVLVTLWDWFVADTFDIRTISFLEALGVSLVVSYLTFQPNLDQESDDRTIGEVLLKAALIGTLISGWAWVCGAVIHGLQ